MTQENINKLRKNLIFLQRLGREGEEGISDSTFIIDKIEIPVTLIKTNDFTKCYRALEQTKRKIPARILRHCKEQMYQLVKSTEPDKKLCVLNIEEIDDATKVEFLVGVGVVSEQDTESPASVGYSAISFNDLIQDLFSDETEYDAKQILDHAIPNLLKNSPNVPIFKYLNLTGIYSKKDYKTSGYKFDKSVNRELKDFGIKSIKRTFFKYRHMDLARVGTVSRRKRRNRTHEILMPSENPFQTALFLQICMFPARHPYGYGIPPNHTYALSCKRI
jgi:hypothetical protein